MTIVSTALMASLLSVLLLLVAFRSVFAAEAATGGSRRTWRAFLNDLGKKVSDFTTLKTDFVQEKEMAMFKEKLVMKGRIYLQKPNKVAWHVDSPVRYSVLITDKLIRQWDEDTNKVQEISLAKNPIFQNVLNQLTVWFSGDYGSLLAVNDIRQRAGRPPGARVHPPGKEHLAESHQEHHDHVPGRPEIPQADTDPGSERRRDDHQLSSTPC